MKISPFTLPCLSFALASLLPGKAAVLVQTFESGEDTSAWGSAWNNGSVAPGFLDPSLGGTSAGGGESLTQSFWRSFRGNTAGIDVTSTYTVGLYLQIDSFDGPSGGQFEIIDGAFGTANAANLRIDTREVTPGNYEFHWQARNGGIWNDLGITLDLGSPYHVRFTVDPADFTYSAVVERVGTTGAVLDSGQVADIAFDPSVITNNQNGELRFYIQASSGGAGVLVDNINIQDVPEPPSLLLGAGGILLLLRRRARPHP